ncbi:MAG: hypothetical protein ABH849_03465 [Nanoarchaeota archaeon]|nr:hypothetical protein [Nanoarchaeota archaeon]
MLDCGRPASVDVNRWLLKILSNDQTSFSGFTSLVDIINEDFLGYNGQITLLPKAAFVEPFVLAELNPNDQERLLDIKEKIRNLDSTRIEEINLLLEEAERIAPVKNRIKGKSPIFFYSVTDKPFKLPLDLYLRMEKAAQIAYDGIAEVASRFNGSIDQAIFGDCCKTEDVPRQLFTGSIDFMVIGNDIYIIDIGSPAVGYVADIVFASEALGRDPNIGLDTLAKFVGKENEVYQGKAKELGFFALEYSTLVEGLKSRGIDVNFVTGNGSEIRIDGTNYPTENFDYLSRNQPLRNKILSAMRQQFQDLRVKTPAGIITSPQEDKLQSFYEQNLVGEDTGIVIKKKVFFKEYRKGSGYFKPLVTPLWSNELRTDRKVSTLYEQFVPSLIDIDINGDIKGKRCYEVRMYFTVGNQFKVRGNQK